MRIFIGTRAVRFLLPLGLAASLFADGKPEGNPESKAPEKAEAAAVEEPVLSVTAHAITLGGKVIRYHATAGYILIKEEEGKPLTNPPQGAAAGKDAEPSKDGLKPKAKVFFVAYTLDDVADPGTRPLTFCFNGGPGSSSIWLHLGALAPRRARLTDEGEAPLPPSSVVDNESTWLDETDLVFIDPVSTGYSRPVPKESAQQFHGLKEDIACVGDFIRLYTSRNARWLSPKFIAGESYGTTRAAGLSDYLQDRYGMSVNGIVLLSSALSYQEIEYTPGNDDPYVNFLPSFATAAWYHRKLPADLQAKSLAEVAESARAFAGTDYALALARGDRMPADERRRVAEQLSRFSGIPASVWAERRLRVTAFQFFAELLRSDAKIIGRYDARFSGIRYEPGLDIGAGEYDPSLEAVQGTFSAALNDYVRRELKFESDLPYELLTDVRPWNFGDASEGFPSTAEDLRHAMLRNPYLKVWVACGYYDLATPFFSVESTFARLNLDPSVRGNLHFTYYPAGHMIYVHSPSRAQFKTDFTAFLQEALRQPVVHTTLP
jgi:carboxypeptidase C (cathepsin A)